MHISSIYIFLFNSESADDKLSKHAKKAKKHKKHKKSSKSECKEKSHKKHKKSKKHKHDSSLSDEEVSIKQSGVMNNKFTEIMEKVSKDKTSIIRVEQHSNGSKFTITKPNMNTDPFSLVEEITKTIQNKVLPTLEVASSGSESEG